ncbi:glycoside hydrolase [Acephala macrosclerotiorum]|nr:glycoside hydrolase [Acephala macrosclerotiorum]
MKSQSLLAAAIGVLSLVSAQPHRRRNHIHERQHQHAKKDGDVVVTIVDTVYAEATEVPEVIVYVDQAGKPISTTTQVVNVPDAGAWSTQHGLAPSPSTSATPSLSAISTSSSSSSVAAVTSTAPVVAAPVVNAEAASSSSSSTSAAAVVAAPVESTASPATTSAAAPAQTSTAASTSSSSTSSSSESSGFGISYSPYNSDGTCKTQSQVTTDFESITGYSLVRTYGTDCNQVATVLTAAKAKGMKLFAGIYDLSTLSSEVATIVSAANGDWSSFDTISVGNELVNSGTASASTVVAAISTARTLLEAAGYTGKVVTVDTLVAARANPSLCDASDYCAVNCHPFFDGSYAAADSGTFLQTMIPTLQDVLANKSQQIVITETGWPWKGDTNQKAVPSLENQAAAVSAIKAAFSSTPDAIFLFTAYNTLWKTSSSAQFDAEQYWGLDGRNSPSG